MWLGGAGSLLLAYAPKPRPLLIFSQSEWLIWIVPINSHTWWQTVQIQINWLLQKPTDLDLHCLLGQGMSCSAREGLRPLSVFGYGSNYNEYDYNIMISFIQLYPVFTLNIWTDRAVQTVYTQIRCHRMRLCSGSTLFGFHPAIFRQITKVVQLD